MINLFLNLVKILTIPKNSINSNYKSFYLISIYFENFNPLTDL